MKKSNSILIGIILIGILSVAAIPVTLNSKLMNKHYTNVVTEKTFLPVEKNFRECKHVIIKGIECTIFPGDSVLIEIEKSAYNNVTILQNGDSLVIQYDLAELPAAKVRLFTPAIAAIKAINSHLIIRGKLRPFRALSYDLILSGSQIETLPISKETRVLQFLDEINIIGDVNSLVSLSGAMHINKLSITDVDSVYSEQLVFIKHLETHYNKTSKIKSNSRNGTFYITAQK